MSQFGKLGKAGNNAVEMTNPHKPCHPIRLGPPGGFYCACDDLSRMMLRDTAEAIIARGGSIALLVIAGTYAGRVVAKSMHKTGDITCYTYRKIKDMVSAQPWFTLPLIAVPIINYNSSHPWRPPFIAYSLMVGGWMLNSTGHVLLIASKDEKFKRYTVPTSYVAWGLSLFTAFVSMFGQRKSCCC